MRGQQNKKKKKFVYVLLLVSLYRQSGRKAPQLSAMQFVSSVQE